MLTCTTVRGGVLLSDPEANEMFSIELLDGLDPAFATYDRDSGLITLIGVNRTLVYQAVGVELGVGEPPTYRSVTAYLVSDTPN